MDRKRRPMRVAQSGIFALGIGSHSYLEFDLLEYAAPLVLVQVVAEDGIRDALTHYTTVVSGAYYFVPSAESLRGFASEDEE